MRHGVVRGVAAALAAMTMASAPAAPPLSGTITPTAPPRGPLKPTGPIRIDPSVLDQQMSFDFRHAVVNKQTSGVSMPFPGPPTATAQVAILTLFTHGIVWPEPGNPASAAHMVFFATDKLATADFRSNAFELAKRRAVVLDWYGNFEAVDFPIQLRLSFGQDRAIGSVIFDKGKVLVGPAGQETAIGGYAVAGAGKGMPHRLTIRADLAARTYTVRFEQNGQGVTSPAVPFPAATPAVPAGPQQVTARLTSPKPYVSGAYNLSRLTLSGEPG